MLKPSTSSIQCGIPHTVAVVLWVLSLQNQIQPALADQNAKVTIRVPAEHSTIQAAIDAAKSGDTVLVAPGVYHEALHIKGKAITLCSMYSETEEPRFIHQTVLDGSLPKDEVTDTERRLDSVILIDGDVGEGVKIEGFTIRDGDDGISCFAKVEIAHNRFVNNVDGIDYEGGGGLCRDNVFVANDDDGVDLDLACEAIVTDNKIYDNDDDGIEIRLHEYSGPELQIVIQRNLITGNGEDGIQIIDYPDLSDRRIRIERNLIADNAMAGIGFMSNGDTVEDYRAAPVPEPVEIINNTIANSQFGISGGANALVLNNVILFHLQAGLKNVSGKSEIAHCLLWGNKSDLLGLEPSPTLMLGSDPQLDREFRPVSGSRCIDAGIANLTKKTGEKIELNPKWVNGNSPDLGIYEAETR